MIETGQLGLPDLQRPFVWDRTKVRDLFDSLYRGYPAGHFLFWATDASHGTHQIGANAAKLAPQKLIVDGQQRLTSVFAVLRGHPIVDSDFRTVTIKIAFKPSTREFEVANASTENDPEWLSNISDIWTSTEGAFLFISNFIEQLRTHRDVPAEEAKEIAAALNTLEAVQSYQFTALELSSKLEVEQVAEVFVRTNSKGVTLNQADFILTLMSVYWDEGRVDLEDFCRRAKQPSAPGAGPFNYFIEPSADQLLRVSVGLAFRRAQLRSVYQLLRGKDLESGLVSVDQRAEQFERLQTAQAIVLDVGNWQEFLKTLLRAGYRSGSMITSDNNILYAYLIYLIGKRDFKIDTANLRDVIARWFFMTALTGRYTGNFESQAERDLRQLDEAKTGHDFIEIVERIIETNLTNDFWEVSLPEALSTSSSYSPPLFAYSAALSLLDAKVLFSTLTVRELLDPVVKGKKSAIERHHLFPKGYLKSINIKGISRTNQIANYAFVEWPENIAISDKKPSEYFPQFWAQVPAASKEPMRFAHALPANWENLEYFEFLALRRKLMAEVIRAAYEKLTSGVGPFDEDLPHVGTELPSVADLLELMETDRVEFKRSARHSSNPDVPEKVIHDGVVKTVAAFLNSLGGTLAIGISDDGDVVGIQDDLDMKGHDLDAYTNWLTTLLETQLGGTAVSRTSIRFETIEEATVCLVDCKPANEAVFANTTKGKHVFFVRSNNSSRVLEGDELLKYVSSRWSTK